MPASAKWVATTNLAAANVVVVLTVMIVIAERVEKYLMWAYERIHDSNKFETREQ